MRAAGATPPYYHAQYDYGRDRRLARKGPAKRRYDGKFVEAMRALITNPPPGVTIATDCGAKHSSQGGT